MTEIEGDLSLETLYGDNGGVAYDMPMKWYKFSVYFRLWMEMLSCLAVAIMIFSWSFYGQETVAMYEGDTALMIVDFTYAFFMICLLCKTAMVRSVLVNKNSGAVRQVVEKYVFAILIDVVAIICRGFFAEDGFDIYVGEFPIYMFHVVIIVANVLLLFAERAYYEERKQLFNQ